jgi:hypothetical protein
MLRWPGAANTGIAAARIASNSNLLLLCFAWFRGYRLLTDVE